MENKTHSLETSNSSKIVKRVGKFDGGNIARSEIEPRTRTYTHTSLYTHVHSHKENAGKKKRECGRYHIVSSPYLQGRVGEALGKRHAYLWYKQPIGRGAGIIQSRSLCVSSFFLLAFFPPSSCLASRFVCCVRV
ncbi:hypothetical protein BU24DRAFT_9135 [Aaosphaeria arxii CBS 175.79]|uniref:Uncharacterized protein n=1 Tax=Aaosphaeria arxii CBS 175.79 TaxID=1450172 RepID=A0A6A5Y5N7_9PLEO|nr:uncharacterized protein BU24DRAFT_9135 [Aaosphaeria arxii CBS 175.79]KAF2020828.1 hypothetical protein BU24DRAFT_9135 [Aaosphaeria arxii CBS 175.79]